MNEVFPLFRVFRVVVVSWLIPYAAAAQPLKSVLPDGVTTGNVMFFSEGVQCFGRMFLPKGLTADSRVAAVVLAPGWGETGASIEKYAARFAARGLAAMAIDYRGWGRSGGFLYLADPVAIIATPTDRSTRGVERKLAAVWTAVERACEREDFRPNPSRLCDWCGFKAYCPSFGGDIALADTYRAQQELELQPV